MSQDYLCFFFLFLVARIGFQQGRYDFLENAGLTMTVMVVLSNEVITPFSVRVIGGERKCFELLFCYKKISTDPGSPPPPIQNSGNPVDHTLTFAANNASDVSTIKYLIIFLVT